MEEGAEEILTQREKEISLRKDAEWKNVIKTNEIEFTNKLNKLNQQISKLMNEVDKEKETSENKLKELTFKKNAENSINIEKLRNVMTNDQQNKEKIFNTKINSLIQNQTEELNQLKNVIKAKDLEIEHLNKNKDLEIASSKDKMENYYKDQINDFKNTISNLNSQIDNLKNDFNNKFNELTLKKNAENSINIEKISSSYENKISYIKSEAQKEISELKIKNAENRILQSKTKGEN